MSSKSPDVEAGRGAEGAAATGGGGAEAGGGAMGLPVHKLVSTTGLSSKSSRLGGAGAGGGAEVGAGGADIFDAEVATPTVVDLSIPRSFRTFLAGSRIAERAWPARGSSSPAHV